MRQKINWEKRGLRVGVISQSKGLLFLVRAQIPCDLIELRLDYFTLNQTFLHELQKKLVKRKHPVLLTLRSQTEGGQQKLTSVQRETILLNFLSYIDAVDIEHAQFKTMPRLLKTIKKKKIPLILSAHSFQKFLNHRQLNTLLQKMKKYPATIYKIASRCDSVSQLTLLLQNQIQFNSLSLALMGMGKMASLSRQLLPLVGSKLVYGYLDAPTAPGQPPIKTLPVVD